MALATLNNRKLWLGSLLLLTVLAALWPVPDREPASSKARDGIAASRHHDQAATVGVAFAPLAGATATDQSALIGDLFPQQTWVPPPPPPPPAVQQAPAAPPLPFTYGGRYTEGSDTMIFLVEGNQVHRVRQGDTVKEIYRVERIEQASISLTYLPLGTTHILPTGGLLP